MMGGVVNFIIRCFKKGNGTEEVAKDVAEAKKQVGLFGKGLEALGGSANVAGRMLRSVMTGSLWEAGARGIMFVWEKFNEWKERSVAAAREVAKAFADSMARAADKVERQFRRITDAIGASAARAREALALGNARGETGRAEATRAINAETRKRLANAQSASERAVIEAEGNLKIAQAEKAESIRRGMAEQGDAALARAVERVSAAESRLAELTEKRQELAGNYFRARAAASQDEERIKAAEEALGKMAEREAKARDDLAKAKEEEAASANAAKIADEKRAQAVLNANNSVEAAEAALAEAKKAQAKAAEDAAKKTRSATLAAQIDERERAMLAKAETDSARAVVKAQASRARARLKAAEAESGADEAAKVQARAAVAKAEADLDEARRKHAVAEEQRRLDKEEKTAREAMAEAMESMAEQGKKKLAETNRQIDGLKSAIQRVKDNAARVSGAVSRFGRSTGRAGYLFADWQQARVNQEKAVAADEKADSKSRRRYERLARWRDRGGRLTGKDAQFVADWEAYADSKRSTEDEENKLAELQQHGNDLLAEIRDYLKASNVVKE